MAKKAVSVTLDDRNVLWLKSRTLARKGRSLSETLDDLVTAARTAGQVLASDARSVFGTVDIAADDPNLDRADAAVYDLVNASLARPFLMRDAPPPYGEPPRKPRSRRRG